MVIRFCQNFHLPLWIKYNNLIPPLSFWFVQLWIVLQWLLYVIFFIIVLNKPIKLTSKIFHLIHGHIIFFFLHCRLWNTSSCWKLYRKKLTGFLNTELYPTVTEPVISESGRGPLRAGVPAGSQQWEITSVKVEIGKRAKWQSAKTRQKRERNYRKKYV